MNHQALWLVLELLIKIFRLLILLIFVLFCSTNVFAFEIVNQPFPNTSNNIFKANDLFVKIEGEKIKKSQFVIGIKKGNEIFKFKIINILDSVYFHIKPLADIKSRNICPEKCDGEFIALSAIEEFEIYNRYLKIDSTPMMKRYDEMFGLAMLRFGISGGLSIAGESYSVFDGYGVGFQKFLAKTWRSNFFFGVSSGLNINFFKADLSQFNFSYVDEILNRASFINLSCPVSFHVVPFSFLDFNFGFNFNANIIPISNDVKSTSGGKDLLTTSGLSGGLSLGFHVGVNFIFDKFLVEVVVFKHTFPLFEDEQYQVIENGDIEQRNRLTKHYEVEMEQVYIGLGMSF